MKTKTIILLLTFIHFGGMFNSRATELSKDDAQDFQDIFDYVIKRSLPDALNTVEGFILAKPSSKPAHLTRG